MLNAVIHNLVAVSKAAVLLFLVCASSLAADLHVVDIDKRQAEAYRQRTDTVRVRYLAEDGILLIRVSSLYGGVTRDLGNALREFFSSDKTPLNGLILDLRDNRGGVLFESVGVISVLMSP